MYNMPKNIFMIHKHSATHLHYDLRLEIAGTLKSWALRTIIFKPTKPVLAILVADHPLWYRHFEGVIPEGHYGAGPVMVWDKGLFSSFMIDPNNKLVSIEESFNLGIMMIWIEGIKIKGGYILVRISTKQKWLMIKMEDEYSEITKGKNWNRSVKSGKTLSQIFTKINKKIQQY